jgi:hypothetical protein
MSRWYPIAALVEECRTALAGVSGSISNRVPSPRSDRIIPIIHHCFDRLQLWCHSFDVDSYGLDRKLRQSASLSGMVLDILDKLKATLDAVRKGKTDRVSLTAAYKI